MKILQKILKLTVIVDKFLNFFQNFYLKKVNKRAFYCLSLRFPNFQKNTLQIKKVILHKLLQEFGHTIWLIHGLNTGLFATKCLQL